MEPKQSMQPMGPMQSIGPVAPVQPLSATTPTPGRHARRAELASLAWTEALTMAGPHPDPGPARRPPGELAADALRAHSALVAGLGRYVPVTCLEPGARGVHGVRGLAAFLAVYAAHYQRQDARDLGTAA
ncbi:hypothetical protein ABZ354_28375 [Streptomyces sp. NPDC005925]|uniref:hypothetical protein n=1 Tax=Streptomyces sp. NPDC005925 TaxID=3157172 RepID=UPI0033E74898